MPRQPSPLFLGLDFGTESVRAVAVDRRGRTLGSASAPYVNGQIVPGSPSAVSLFARPLPGAAALQHPGDWLSGSAEAVRGALAGGLSGGVAGIGVDFTSCTMLPALADGTPLCFRPEHQADLHAWPKLWKHHGALDQTERINRAARARGEPWLARYGGAIGLEWFWPKILEVIEQSPAAAAGAEVWLEAGDWFVWQLIGAPWRGGGVEAAGLPRSTCQAGYKACWSAQDGYPSHAFFSAVHPALGAALAHKMPGTPCAPGRSAGRLCARAASDLGLRSGIPVSGAIIDAHAGVPGAGAGGAGELVLVMGTSGCHMVMAEQERLIPGVAGIVRDGILPGLFGYETGQASMGDSFDLVRRLAGEKDFAALDRAAADVPAGADGVLCLDWFNGCRTPLMDGSLTGAFLGLSLHHGAAHLYRAALEGSAMGMRWIVQTLESGGVPTRRIIATGGLPAHNPLLVRIAAAVLARPIEVHGAPNGPALGAAILGALAAGASGGGFDSAAEAVDSMAGRGSDLPPPAVVQPDPAWAEVYEPLYGVYRSVAGMMSSPDSPARALASLRRRGP
jgi:L-ribulokinase